MIGIDISIALLPNLLVELCVERSIGRQTWRRKHFMHG